MVRTTLAHCRRIYLREGLSEAYVAAVLGGLDSNVERAADMAFLLTPPAVPRTRSCHEPVVAVTIRAFPFAHRDTADSERERLSNVVVDTLTDLLEGNRLVRIVIVVQVAGDAEPSGTLRNRLARFEHRVTLVEPRHPDDLMSVYQRASVLVATRLHSTIYAALAGTPSVHIVSDAHKGFGISDDLGLRGWCVAAESVDREVLTARITSLMGDREVVSRQVSERINGLRRSAEKALGEALSLDAAFTP
jgi:polysaccharide pyruvyl transferase WcaK-like protein